MAAFVHQVKRSQKILDHSPIATTSGRFVFAELTLPPGAWVVFAKAEVSNVGSDAPQAETVNFFLESIDVPGSEDRQEITIDVGERKSISLGIGANLPRESRIQLTGAAFITRVLEISNVTLSAIGIDSITITEDPLDNPGTFVPGFFPVGKP